VIGVSVVAPNVARVMAIARVEPLTTARALRGPFDYLLPRGMEEVEVGAVLRVPFGGRRMLGVVVEIADRSELDAERLAQPIAALESGVPAELVRLGLWTAREYCSTPARGLRLVLPPITPGGRLRRSRNGTDDPGADIEVGASARPVHLSGAQDSAVEAIVRAVDGGGAERELLLHGVTGSGKTEVYLAAATAALERGRGAIVLVPEIALTPQTVGRFRRRFGDTVALLHSQMSPGARADEWRRLRDGAARVCVGPRSAAFAPVSDLGLVVIDEEHDPSYKQEGDPRYDARRIAARRAAEAGAALVAGSATPRPESWLAMRRLELPSRVDGRRLPPVELVDMRASRSPGPLAPRTLEALRETAGLGGKAIVLLNRRGWAPFLCCRSCGRAFECPRCDVSLVLHRRAERLTCHHCGHAEEVPNACPECGSVTLARQGAGTERLEAELAGALEPLPVFRFDSDSAAGGAHGAILTRFEQAGPGVLLGTQMVAKGHDFPDVMLSVVLDADATLRFPDFRAEERTFALVSQLAGRSGRGERGGRVIVQTLSPEAPSIAAAARHDAAGFLAGELRRRKELGYPPFSHLIRIGLAAAERGDALGVARRLAEALDAALPADSELLGPAPLFRLRGRHRQQLLVKSLDRGAGIAAVRDTVERAAHERALRGAALSVDVDPQ
jgi:primosomal protein N' (replication factor Y) (superfamily II helicase)